MWPHFAVSPGASWYTEAQRSGGSHDDDALTLPLIDSDRVSEPAGALGL